MDCQVAKELGFRWTLQTLITFDSWYTYLSIHFLGREANPNYEQNFQNLLLFIRNLVQRRLVELCWKSFWAASKNSMYHRCNPYWAVFQDSKLGMGVIDSFHLTPLPFSNCHDLSRGPQKMELVPNFNGTIWNLQVALKFCRCLTMPEKWKVLSWHLRCVSNHDWRSDLGVVQFLVFTS